MWIALTIINAVSSLIALVLLVNLVRNYQVDPVYLKFIFCLEAHVMIVFLYQFYSYYLGTGNWVFKLATIVLNVGVYYYVDAKKCRCRKK